MWTFGVECVALLLNGTNVLVRLEGHPTHVGEQCATERQALVTAEFFDLLARSFTSSPAEKLRELVDQVCTLVALQAHPVHNEPDELVEPTLHSPFSLGEGGFVLVELLHLLCGDLENIKGNHHGALLSLLRIITHLRTKSQVFH